jgi:hypothetical protein
VDAVKNFAWSTVATAPSPATTGTSLTVTAGEGARYPAVPFNASVFPAGTMPTPANAEIVRVTARTTDVLTITRTQEGSSARAIGIGDQIAAAITAKTLTDLDLGFANPMSALGDVITGAASGVPQRLAIGPTNTVLTIVGGVPTWAANAAMLNPMTNVGDVIFGGTAGAPTRLAAVATGAVLASAGVGVAPTWNTTPTVTRLNAAVDASGVGMSITGYYASINISKNASGEAVQIVGQKSGLNRWVIALGDTTAETGGNAGSNFAIYSATDAGAFLATPFTILRNDGTNPISIIVAGLARFLTCGAPDSGGAGFRMVRVAN